MNDEFDISARIERRTWYVAGKYLGNKSPWMPDNGETAEELTGHHYGGYEGTRYTDGHAVVKNLQERLISERLMLLHNHPDSPLGDAYSSPVKLQDYGEFRVITTANRRAMQSPDEPLKY